MQVQRDRDNCAIWISQEEQSNDVTKYRYAQITGSIGYVAGATRPDVAKAHSKLAEFLINPSQRHLDAAYQTVEYLYATKDHSLHYNASILEEVIYIAEEHENNKPPFYAASDASFADDKTTRKSLQGYIFYLFGGPIDWKATLQRCVTKSTTEAELVAASSASIELI